MVGLPVNLETAREALSEMLNGTAKRITVEEIQKTVANYHGMPVSILLSKRRTRDIVRPRQQAMFLCKEFTTRSLPDIGKRFGDMDHTTVMHACKRISKLMDESAVVRSDVEQLRRLLRQRRERPTIQ
jgi:chromosomal replication initiator protein